MDLPDDTHPPACEQDAWIESVMKAHETALLRYAAGLLRDQHAAQDVVQNVFIKLVRHAPSRLLPADRLQRWLYRVTHNQAVDLIRRESRLRNLHEKQPPPQPPSPSKDAERMEQVLAAMHRLAPHEQQVLLLRLQDGLSYQEISRITGRSEGNVGCLLHHAVRKLAKLLAAPSSSAQGSTP